MVGSLVDTGSQLIAFPGVLLLSVTPPKQPQVMICQHVGVLGDKSNRDGRRQIKYKYGMIPNHYSMGK